MMLGEQLYIACIRLTGKRAVVIGGGTIAHGKIENLLACGARVTLVSPDAVAALRALVDKGEIDWRQRDYETGDLDGALLAIAATDDTTLNARIFEDAEHKGMLVNVVDVPAMCNFILPAIARNGPIAIAVSTSGASPALAKRMRSEIAREYGEPYARLAALLDEVRDWARETLPDYEARRDFFESIVNGEPDPVALLRNGDEDAVRALIERAQSAPSARASDQAIDG